MWMSIRPSFHLPVLHPNTLGGMMALILPFILAFGIYAWHQRQIRWVQLAVVSGAITAGGLLFTSSLGAWLALAVGLGCWFTWAASGTLKKKLPLSQKVIFVGLMLVVLFISLLMVLFILRSEAGQEASATRLGLAQQTLFLIEDFALTGSGLATFPALYAQYIQVTPVFFAAYSNLYLDIWLELGFFTFAATVALLGGSFWLLFKRSAFIVEKSKPGTVPTKGEIIGIRRKRRRSRKPKKVTSQEMILFQWATFVSLVVMALHGLIDDALYGAHASPLLFFAPAMAILVTRRRESVSTAPGVVWRRRWAIGVGVTAVLLAGLFFGYRQKVEAQWVANLGSLALARAELDGWPTNRWDAGDNLERFDEAAALFEQALVIDAQNRTANHRLGVIAMVKRDYETAVTHLEKAEAATTTHRGVTKSLGYSYVWQGQFDEAGQTLAVIQESRAEMATYSNWWKRQNRPDLAMKASEMLALLESPAILLP
jgi:hypothetical protein